MITDKSEPLVLYVDDERGNRVVFEQSLAHEFHLRTAVDAASAIAVFEQHEVAVVVTDMRMPTMSGEDLLRIVKERWPQTIRMVVTAYSDVDPILRAINEGLVARYIVKPWDYDELVQVLRWATEAWALGKEFAAVHRRLLETERLATLGSLSAMLVHDLKQPLMSLAVNIELLRELGEHAGALQQALARSPTPETAQLMALVESLPQITDDVKTSVSHLNELISGLRGFNKAPPAAHRMATDPLPIVKQAMSSCREIAARVHANIVLEGPPTLPRVRIAPTELTQVLINLIANGAQAVTARGVPNGRVVVSTRVQDDGMLAMQIKDTGTGMPPEVLARVGTPFFTTREEGTGLGLANCQRLIGAAGGRMLVDSEVGVGTTVTVMVPIAA